MSGAPKNYLWSAQSYVLFMTKRAYMTLLVHPIHARRFSLCDLFMIIISLIPIRVWTDPCSNELKKLQVIVTKYLLFVIITSQILPIPTSHCMTGSNGLPPLPHSFLVRCGRVCLTKESFRSVRYSYLTFHNTSR